jgi:hypothetical protein
MITASIIRLRRGAKDGPPSKSNTKESSTWKEDHHHDSRVKDKVMSRISDPWPDARPSGRTASLQKRLSRLFRLKNRSSAGLSQDITSSGREPSFFESPTMIVESTGDDANSTLSEESEDASLLEGWSEQGSSNSSGCTGLERTIKHFEKRDKTCSRILADKSAAYREMIIANEMACREKTLGALGCASTDVKMSALRSNNVASPDATRSSTTYSLLQWLQRILLFEFHHSLEAVWKALWYCVGHYSLFNSVDALANLSLRLTSGLNQYAFHGFLIMFGIFIMRLNGYLWAWLRPESYRLVKFDMHNRAVLGAWDARILAVLRKPSFSDLNPMVSMLAFYTLYMGVQFYYDAFVKCWETVFWGFQQRLEKQVIGVIQVPPETLPCDAFLFIEKPTLLNEITHYLCAHYEGDPESIIPTVAFYIVVATVAALAMARSGGSLFEL